jgi:ElaB/YqjD/DUF883 family membrane-anchored ribosome-binding protein
LNYFNYFTEIEDTFIRRRGKHLLLSSMDWALIESWKEMGVPLYVALRGIEQAFDSFEAKPRKRSVKTLLYCQEEVEAQFAEWRESHVGASAEESEGETTSDEVDVQLPFSRDAILSHVQRAIEDLGELLRKRKAVAEDDFCDTLARVTSRLEDLKSDFENAVRPIAERLEDSLTSLEKMLDDALLESIGSDELEAMRAEVQAQLKSYRRRMDVAMYKQTFDNMLLKRLREQRNIPRLSLFFL